MKFKKIFFFKWSFFLGDCDQAFEKAAYVPFSWRIKSRHSSKNSFEKSSFLKWGFFLGDCNQAFEKPAYVPLS